jgi:glycosyltransferase involved in cell wall biosynthesis
MSAPVRTHIHVPTPGELVSPLTGSAVVTISRALGTAHLASGGKAAVVARAGMAHDARPLELLESELPDKVWLTRAEKVGELAFGAVAGRWPAHDRLWAPIWDAIPQAHRGPVFLHNAPAAAAGFRRRFPDGRGVVYLHNDALRGWTTAARQRLVQRSPVVCVSRFLAKRQFPGAVDRGEVLALVNGVDTDAFHPATDEREPTVLFVGKVTLHKGPELLVEAARLLFEEGLRFRLRIVGGAALSAQDGLTAFERALRTRAEPLGELAEFLPFVDRDHLPAIYRSATIMVAPSNWDEPCTLVLPEAMASGLACVASRRGGLVEAGGSAPLYFDPPDVLALAACLRRLLTDPAERNERAAAARERAEQLSWPDRLTVLADWLDGWSPQ